MKHFHICWDPPPGSKLEECLIGAMLNGQVLASLVASTRAAADPSFVMYCNSRETDGDEIVNFMSELANTTRFLRFKNCDMTRLDFGFLARLDLRHLQVEGGKLREFRGMPRLERLSVVEVSAAGFRRWYGPDLTPQLWSVRLEGAVDDESMDDIVDALLPYAATLQHLELRRTSLTRLPDRLALLAGVFVNVEGNTRPLTIPFGSVSGTFPYFSVRDSKIDSIEAGAFQGTATWPPGTAISTSLASGTSTGLSGPLEPQFFLFTVVRQTSKRQRW